MKGLVYNSMVSMAGGWFFLSIIEAFTLGDQDYRVRGLGSYMSVAQEQNNGWAQVYDVIAMIIMIVLLDQLVWRPLIVWSNKFKIEDTESEFQDRSAVLRYLGRSRVAGWLQERFDRWMRKPVRLCRLPSSRSRRHAGLSWTGFRGAKSFCSPAFVLIARGCLYGRAVAWGRCIWRNG